MKSDKNYFLLPLKNMVIFPDTQGALFVGREKSIVAMQKAMKSNRKVVLFTQKDIDIVTPKRSDLVDIGVMCEVLQLLRMPDGTYKALIEAIQRVRLVEFFEKKDTYEAKVEILTSRWPKSNNQLERNLLSSLLDKLYNMLLEFNAQANFLSKKELEELTERKKSETFIDFVGSLLPIPVSLKQTLLSTLDILERTKLTLDVFGNQVELDKLENNIHEKVRKQVGKAQKDFYLNEQMKLIKEELGDEDNEIKIYRKKLKEKNLPEEVLKIASQEIDKIEKMAPISAESTVTRNYIDCILELPWGEFSEDTAGISKAEKELDKSHFGLGKIKERILEYIAVKQLSKTSKSPILCFLGPPGVGKTSLARSFANCLNRKYIRIALGGIRDEAEIRGHRKTYIGALPGRIIQSLKRAGTMNPVILLDEVDKIGFDYRGNPAAALLEVLDPEQNNEFLDHYLDIPVDLSQVLFIATANAAHTIPEPLMDRLEILEVPGYIEQEKIKIATNHLLPQQVRENGIPKKTLKYSSNAISYIVRHYTKEAGVRQLNRKLAKICRKIARKIIEQENHESQILNSKSIPSFLGPEQYDYGRKEPKGVIGKCNGLAWTSAGGDILNIEAALAHGKGNVSITGNLGDIMKESVNTAIGCIRSRGHLLSLEPEFFEKTDIFFHVPEGAIPKDGPSAGVATALCLVSILAQNPVRNDVALTGEITLRGRILPIGGLREKVLAAFRGGIKEVICPEKNKKDLEDIPKEIASQIKFHFVDELEEVLEIALLNPKPAFKKSSPGYSFRVSHLPDLKETWMELGG